LKTTPDFAVARVVNHLDTRLLTTLANIEWKFVEVERGDDE